MTLDAAAVDAIVRHSLELPADFPLTPETTPDDVPGWDSLGWINIFNALNERLAGEITLADLADAESVGDLHRLAARAA